MEEKDKISVEPDLDSISPGASLLDYLIVILLFGISLGCLLGVILPWFLKILERLYG